MNFTPLKKDLALSPKATLIICISLILSLANASASEPKQKLDQANSKIESGSKELPTISKAKIDDFAKDYPSDGLESSGVDKGCSKRAAAKKKSLVNERMDLATGMQKERESLDQEYTLLKDEPTLGDEADIISDKNSISTKYISPSKKADIKININDEEC